MRDATKRVLWRAGSRVFWRLGMRWYGLTERVGDAAGHPIKLAASIDEIRQRLQGGGLYKLDPLGGRLDVLTHPRVVQRKLGEGQKIGDCEDHAGYWAACLLKSKLVASASFVSVQFQYRSTGKIEGHVLCEFRQSNDPMYYTVDYETPFASTDPWGFVQYVCARYDAVPVFATKAKLQLDETTDTLTITPTAGKGFR